MYIIYFMFVATHEAKTFYLLLQDNSRVAIETCHIALQTFNPLLCHTDGMIVRNFHGLSCL